MALVRKLLSYYSKKKKVLEPRKKKSRRSENEKLMVKQGDGENECEVP